jgi:hypothetical protein
MNQDKTEKPTVEQRIQLAELITKVLVAHGNKVDDHLNEACRLIRDQAELIVKLDAKVEELQAAVIQLQCHVFPEAEDKYREALGKDDKPGSGGMVN